MRVLLSVTFAVTAICLSLPAAAAAQQKAADQAGDAKKSKRTPGAKTVVPPTPGEKKSGAGRKRPKQAQAAEKKANTTKGNAKKPAAKKAEPPAKPGAEKRPAAKSKPAPRKAQPSSTITDPTAARRNPSFRLQGEYITQPNSDPASAPHASSPMGLQVVAMGKDGFAGVLYPGGLPGNGWHGGDRVELTGSVKGGRLVLKGDGRIVNIQNKKATVADGSDRDPASLRKVTRRSVSLGAKPPSGASILFNGSGTDRFKNGKMTDDGLLLMGTEFADTYNDFSLHIEFRLPFMPDERGQKRGNSGVYLQSRYEVQVLDSFGLEGIENECAALYRYKRPDVNMCFPPLSWQTYDIGFRSPRFDASGNKICNGRITVLHNGVPVHNNFEIERKTGAGKPESPAWLPIKLQNHNNPVVFRNIWLIDYSQSSCLPCLGGSPEYLGLIPEAESIIDLAQRQR